MSTKYSTFNFVTTFTILLLVITLIQTSCGGGSSNDTQAPPGPALVTSDATPCYGAPSNPQDIYLVICYPTPYANVVAVSTTIVSGRIIDPTGNPISAGDVTSVNINGNVATLDPLDPSYWSVSIPVSPGHSTTIDAVASFVASPDSAVSLVVNNSDLLSRPVHIALAPSGSNAYVTDFDYKSVLYQNLVTGERNTFSGNGAGTGTAFSDPRSAAIDIARDLLYVSDVGLQKIVKVDLTTGNRIGVIPTPAIASGCNPNDATLDLCYPETILYDSANNRLLVQDSTENAIMAINVVSGTISLIADATTTATPSFNGGYGMALDSTNNRLLIAEYNINSVSAINLNTGARTVISDNTTSGTGPAFSHVIGVVQDSANNRAIVLDEANSALVAVNLTTGDRNIISDNNTGSGPDILVPTGIASLSGSGQVFMPEYRSILKINLSNGNRTYVSDTPISGPYLSQPIDAAWDYVNERLLAIGSGGNNLYAAKLDTGLREIIADQNITPALPLEADQLGTNRTSRVTLTGGLTQIVDMQNLNRIQLSTSYGKVATIDYANNRTLSYNSGTYNITAIDLDSGVATVVANLQALTPKLYLATAMVYDADNDRLLMTATTSAGQVTGLYAIDMGSNTATVLSTQFLTQSQWKMINDLSLDLAYDQVYALVSNLNASYLLTFNLTSGAADVVYATTAINLQNPRGFYVDTENRRAFVADYQLGILVFDLASGQSALALR